jgi:Domain of unknown function (DUF4129)
VRRAVAALACVLTCAAWPAAARAAEATTAEVRALAAAAQRDPAVLQRLRAIDAVDGRPARLGAALVGRDADVRARLRALAQAAPPAASAPSPDGARERARDVLKQQRFQRTSVPAPLRSVRERIGEGLRSLGRPFEDAFQWIVGWIPGGRAVLWALLATVLLGAAALLAGRTGADRVSAAGAVAGAGDPQGVSAARLRQEADRAERSGNLDEALRLRFRAGLVDLDSRELIELRPALTNHELLRDVPSATLAGLVDGFESVAYGGRPADPDDLRTARDGWPRVPGEALDP